MYHYSTNSCSKMLKLITKLIKVNIWQMQPRFNLFKQRVSPQLVLQLRFVWAFEQKPKIQASVFRRGFSGQSTSRFEGVVWRKKPRLYLIVFFTGQTKPKAKKTTWVIDSRRSSYCCRSGKPLKWTQGDKNKKKNRDVVSCLQAQLNRLVNMS